MYEIHFAETLFYDQSNVNHAGFDDVKQNLFDNDCHHQKGGECECMNT